MELHLASCLLCCLLPPAWRSGANINRTWTTPQHTHTPGQNRKRHAHSLHFTPILWQDITVYQLILLYIPKSVCVGLCACMCVCMYACVHVCVNCTHRCQVMTSHLLIPCCFYYPLSIPFHLCALSLWMTAWLQSPSVPQPNLSNLVVSKVWCDNSSRSAQTPTRCSVNIRQMDVLMLVVRVLCAISE